MTGITSSISISIVILILKIIDTIDMCIISAVKCYCHFALLLLLLLL